MRFFAAALIFFGVAASNAQTPQVPHKIHFAGMSLTIHDDAKREIQKDVDALTKSHRYYTMHVERARTYFPIIEKIFKEENLPEDFKFLALQESSLVSDAVSVSNAVGFWQFKDYTAQEMGMRVDREVDERMNIFSSSRGAAKYIKQNNWYFNNWLLALQAYQMGKGGVKEAVGEKYNGDTHMEINSQTYWYVKKYLAYKIAFEDACEATPQLTMGLYETKGKQKLSEIAEELSISENTLRDYNKWIKSGVIPGDKPYLLAVPGGFIPEDFDMLVLKPTKMPEASIASMKGKPLDDVKFHINGILVIKALQGETVSAISKRAGLDVTQFITYNDISIDARINPGMYYFTKRKKKKSHYNSYQAKPGDNLWLVSQQQGIRLEQLRKLNPGANSLELSAGTVIHLNKSKRVEPLPLDENEQVAELGQEAFAWAIQSQPKKEEPKVPIDISASPVAQTNTGQELVKSGDNVEDVGKPAIKTETVVTYEVKPADTLYGIARQFGATIKDIMEWNNKSSLTVSPGEKLKILKK